MTELVQRWHWTMGNGCVPFPGRRVESTSPALSGTMYEIREYLGNDMIISYREIFPGWSVIPEGDRWRYVEARFLEYLEDPNG